MKPTPCPARLVLAVSLAACLLLPGTALSQTAEAKPEPSRSFTEVARFKAAEARQAVAVDDKHFYAVTDFGVGKYEKATGKFVAKWEKSKDHPILHLDSAAVVDGKIYLAHSNYPQSPMTSSIEILDAATLKHVGSHSLGIQLGSLTWLDRSNGVWWGVFANYSRVFGQSQQPYGNSYWTTLVKFDASWRVEQAWVFPESIIKRCEPMSVSGGSWGPDGELYVTGHDNPEVYLVRIPKAGSVLEHVETIPVPAIAGQGIAWDRSKPGDLYGIVRKTGEVTVSRMSRKP